MRTEQDNKNESEDKKNRNWVFIVLSVGGLAIAMLLLLLFDRGCNSCSTGGGIFLPKPTAEPTALPGVTIVPVDIDPAAPTLAPDDLFKKPTGAPQFESGYKPTPMPTQEAETYSCYVVSADPVYTEKKPNLFLGNDKNNKVYTRYQLIDATTGDTIYTSNFVEPGVVIAINMLELFEAGEYNIRIVTAGFQPDTLEPCVGYGDQKLRITVK